MDAWFIVGSCVVESWCLFEISMMYNDVLLLVRIMKVFISSIFWLLWSLNFNLIDYTHSNFLEVMHEKIDQQKFNSHQISHYFETPPSSITPKDSITFLQPSISRRLKLGYLRLRLTHGRDQIPQGDGEGDQTTNDLRYINDSAIPR